MCLSYRWDIFYVGQTTAHHQQASHLLGTLEEEMALEFVKLVIFFCGQNLTLTDDEFLYVQN